MSPNEVKPAESTGDLCARQVRVALYECLIGKGEVRLQKSYTSDYTLCPINLKRLESQMRKIRVFAVNNGVKWPV